MNQNVQYLLLLVSSLCSEFLSADDKLERFESLLDMTEKKADCLTPTNQVMLSAFGRAMSDWKGAWPLLEENMTCESNPRPDSFDDYYRTSFVEYVPGIVRYADVFSHTPLML